MSTPSISVIIPLYRAEDYLDGLLTQLREQPLQEIEIICVVDGSPDGTLDIAKRHAEKDLRISWIYQENAGAGAARNAGLELAKGEYLAFLDADDTYDPLFLTKMLEAAEEHDADLVVCQFKRVDFKAGREWPGEGYRSDKVPANSAISPLDLGDPFTAFSVVPNNKLFRKAIVDRESLRFSTTRVANDIFFSLAMIASSERIVAIPDSLATQRKFINEHSISSRRAAHAEDVFASFGELRAWLLEHGLFDRHGDTFATAWADAVHYNATYERSEPFIESAVRELAHEEPWRSMSNRELRDAARLDPSPIAAKRLVCSRQPAGQARDIEVWGLRNEEEAVREIVRLLNAEHGRSLPEHANVLIGAIVLLRRIGLRNGMGKIVERMRRNR